MSDLLHQLDGNLSGVDLRRRAAAEIRRLTAEVERKDEVLNMIAHTAKQRKREIKRLRRTITELTADKGRSEDG